MLNKIKFNLQFKKPMWGTDGIYSGEHTFDKGLTVIYGPNESGKSLILEMIRAAFFGSSALRSPLNQYKRLSIHLDFSIKGVSYNINRTKSSATLTSNDKNLAVGTKPVNLAVLELFGYDSDVFNVANACLQGKINELGEMKPSQRKSLVDNVIGLSSIDDTIKDLNLTLRDLKSELKGMTSILSKPKEPNFKLPMEKQELIDFEDTIESHIKYTNLNIELNTLMDIPKPPAVDLIKPKEVKFELAKDYTKVTQANFKYDTISNRMESIEFEEVLATVEQVQDWRTWALKFEASQDVTCPKCGTVFNLQGVDIPAYTSEACNIMLDNLKKEQEYLDLKASRGTFWDVKPYQEAAKEVSDYKIKQTEHLLRQQYFSHTESKIENINKKLLTLDFIQDFDIKEEIYQETILGQMRIDDYSHDLNEYNYKLEGVKDLEEKITNHTEMVQALRNLKTKVKAYLVPSLNKVSSLYLSLLTGGFRNTVVISDNFDINIDGQDIEALSGSAKAVANLSIRLALGQTLTNSVFSVFMADEIDASMDNNRVEYTAKCLRNLTDKVNQVILVSHKKIEADNYLELN